MSTTEMVAYNRVPMCTSITYSLCSHLAVYLERVRMPRARIGGVEVGR